MTRKKPAAESAPPTLLDRLNAEEAMVVLRQLLETHPELRPEAEQLATQYVSSDSIEDTAHDVYDRITGVDLEDLNGRAGRHSWGYVEPGEAAVELMAEAIKDLQEDMKRNAELGLLPAAQAACAGIVQGLYQARDTNSDGALGWAPDFPAEQAGYVVEEYLRACSPAIRKEARKNLAPILNQCAPEWAEDLMRSAKQALDSR